MESIDMPPLPYDSDSDDAREGDSDPNMANITYGDLTNASPNVLDQPGSNVNSQDDEIEVSVPIETGEINITENGGTSVTNIVCSSSSKEKILEANLGNLCRSSVNEEMFDEVAEPLDCLSLKGSSISKPSSEVLCSLVDGITNSNSLITSAKQLNEMAARIEEEKKKKETAPSILKNEESRTQTPVPISDEEIPGTDDEKCISAMPQERIFEDSEVDGEIQLEQVVVADDSEGKVNQLESKSSEIKERVMSFFTKYPNTKSEGTTKASKSPDISEEEEAICSQVSSVVSQTEESVSDCVLGTSSVASEGPEKLDSVESESTKDINETLKNFKFRKLLDSVDSGKGSVSASCSLPNMADLSISPHSGKEICSNLTNRALSASDKSHLKPFGFKGFASKPVFGAFKLSKTSTREGSGKNISQSGETNMFSGSEHECFKLITPARSSGLQQSPKEKSHLVAANESLPSEDDNNNNNRGSSTGRGWVNKSYNPLPDTNVSVSNVTNFGHKAAPMSSGSVASWNDSKRSDIRVLSHSKTALVFQSEPRGTPQENSPATKALKLSFQPSTTSSINFPIFSSRASNNSPDHIRLKANNSQPWNSSSNFSQTDSDTTGSISSEEINSTTNSSVFNFLPDKDKKQIKPGEVGFGYSFGPIIKVVKGDLHRANTSPFDTTGPPFVTSPKKQFNFSRKASKQELKGQDFAGFAAPVFVTSSIPCEQSESDSAASGLSAFKFKPVVSENLKIGTNAFSQTPEATFPPILSGSSSKGGQEVFQTAESSANPPVTVPNTVNPSPRKARRINTKVAKSSAKLPLKERLPFQFTSKGIPPVPFKCVIGSDLAAGSTTQIQIRYQHIACMEEYKSFSPEELRYEYYNSRNAPFGFFMFCAASDKEQRNSTRKYRTVDTQTTDVKYPTADKALREIWRALECPVCLDVCLPPVFQCEQGHHACFTCWGKMVACPLCKRGKTNSRNYMAEALLEQVPLPCRYHIEGCQETVQRANKVNHEQTCMFRMYQCPFHLCNQAFSYQNMCKHFKKCHKALLHHEGYSVMKENKFCDVLYKDQLFPSLIHAFDIPKWGLFFLRQSTVRFSAALYLQVMPAAVEGAEHSYQLEICDHFDCRKESYKGRVSAMGKMPREIIDQEEYLLVSDLLMKTVKKESPLKIVLTIW